MNTAIQRIVYGSSLSNLARGLVTSSMLSKTREPPKVKVQKKPKEVAELRSGPDLTFDQLPVVIVKATYNNTLVYLTDHNGLTSTWTSAGIEGFKNAKRGTNYAGQTAGHALAEKAASLGVDRVRVKVKGMGPGRQSCVKGLVTGGLDIVSITDITPMPHNGPRPKKQRRL